MKQAEKDGAAALEAAKHFKFSEIVQLLTDAGAK